MSQSIAPERKRCSKCKQTKDISEFNRDSKRLDGYRSQCKECAKNASKRKCDECKEKKCREDVIVTGRSKSYCIPCWNALQGRKKCIGCKEIKDIQEFAEDKSRPGGHEYYCKDCRREHQVNKYAKEILLKGKKRCLDCRITKNLSEFPQDNRARDGAGLFCTMCCNGEKVEAKPGKDYSKGGQAERQLRSLYKITREDRKQMFEQQKGLCAICGRPEGKSKRTILCVDHNHETGKVRALLCGNCNNAPGMFEENIEYLSKAIEYLKQHE